MSEKKEEKSILQLMREQCPQKDGIYDVSNFPIEEILLKNGFRNAVSINLETPFQNGALNKGNLE